MEDVTFQHGSEEDILKSIKNKLLRLPEDTVIYPGHGEPGLILEEKLLYWYMYKSSLSYIYMKKINLDLRRKYEYSCNKY